MKRIALVILSMVVALSTVEVRGENLQEIETQVNDIPIEKKGRFQFGATIRYGSSFFLSMEEAIVFAGGYRFNKRNYLGLNVGVAKVEDVLKWEDSEKGTRPIKYIGCPMSLDYIHYFPLGKAKKHSIVLGTELGYICSFGKSYVGKYTDSRPDEKVFATPIIILKTGMEHPINKRLHLNWGIRVGVLAAGVSLGVTI